MLDEIVELRVPSRDVRAKVLQLRPNIKEQEVQEMAEGTQYFRIRNLVNLINAADMKAFVEVERQIFVD